MYGAIYINSFTMGLLFPVGHLYHGDIVTNDPRAGKDHYIDGVQQLVVLDRMYDMCICRLIANTEADMLAWELKPGMVFHIIRGPIGEFDSEYCGPPAPVIEYASTKNTS
jgi:hypothetical protein